MPTCLFTGQETGPLTTKVEHTIPRALGGRYCSRTVSSTEFNEQCSRVVDPYLIGPYIYICNALGPLLSREHEPGSISVSVKDTHGRFVIEPGSVLKRIGLSVSRDSKTGLPTAVTGGDELAIRHFARQQGWDEGKLGFEPIPGNGIVQAKVHGVSKEFELGAMKAALLTFDHVLEGHPNRFTRSNCVAFTIERVRRAIMENMFDEAHFSSSFWGIRYDLAPAILDLRKRYCQDPAPTEFEHILLATGNPGSRNLDVIWSVFGFEPICFRISRDWVGPDFTYLTVCGSLKGCTSSGLVDCGVPFRVGNRSDLCTFHPYPISEGQLHERGKHIGRQRQEAYRRALYLVEMTADDALTEEIHYATSYVSPAGSPGLVADGVRFRLEQMYLDRVITEDTKSKFIEILSRHFLRLEETVRSETIGKEGSQAPHVSWPKWIEAHRAILRDLEMEFGLPGAMSEPLCVFKDQAALKPGELLAWRAPGP